MKNKKIIISIICLLVTSLCVTGCGQEIEVKDGSKVAVSTKGGKITATDYYQKIKEDNISILIDMIDAQMLEKDYATTKEEDEEVKKQINQLKTNYTDEQTQKAILTQHFGVKTFDELEEKLRLEYKRNEAIKDYVSKNLKDKEIEDYYKDEVFGEIKASHILIKPTVSDDATDEEIAEAEKLAKEEAEKIINKLKDGEDFAKLAKKYSDDAANASDGGDLGYFGLDEMVDEFSDAVKELKVGKYTKEPVKSKFGYHIILKTDEKEKPKLEDVKNDIKEKLTEQKLNNDTTLYYQTLIDIRKERNIKWNDSVLEKAYEKSMNELLDSIKESANS